MNEMNEMNLADKVSAILLVAGAIFGIAYWLLIWAPAHGAALMEQHDCYAARGCENLPGTPMRGETFNQEAADCWAECRP